MVYQTRWAWRFLIFGLYLGRYACGVCAFGVFGPNCMLGTRQSGIAARSLSFLIMGLCVSFVGVSDVYVGWIRGAAYISLYVFSPLVSLMLRRLFSSTKSKTCVSLFNERILPL